MWNVKGYGNGNWKALYGRLYEFVNIDSYGYDVFNESVQSYVMFKFT